MRPTVVDRIIQGLAVFANAAVVNKTSPWVSAEHDVIYAGFGGPSGCGPDVIDDLGRGLLASSGWEYDEDLGSWSINV